MPLRSLIIISALLVVATAAFAQPQKNNIHLRTNLLSLLEPQNAGPTIGVEYFITSHFSVGTDVGAILYTVGEIENNNDNLGNPLGYKIKPELRYYLYKENKEKRVRLFFGLEGLFLKTTTRNYSQLPIRDNTGNIVFNYLGGYDEIKKVTGGALKAGIQIPWFITKNMLLEVYAGIGLRNKIYSAENLPAGASVPDRGLDGFFVNTDTDVNGVFPSIPLGFKIIFKIN
jgi:Protein of unknown function (DUF3575)